DLLYHTDLWDSIPITVISIHGTLDLTAAHTHTTVATASHLWDITRHITHHTTITQVILKTLHLDTATLEVMGMAIMVLVDMVVMDTEETTLDLEGTRQEDITLRLQNQTHQGIFLECLQD